eukprot:2502231-Pyramimonas_sp.AAC.1
MALHGVTGCYRVLQFGVPRLHTRVGVSAAHLPDELAPRCSPPQQPRVLDLCNRKGVRRGSGGVQEGFRR